MSPNTNDPARNQIVHNQNQEQFFQSLGLPGNLSKDQVLNFQYNPNQNPAVMNQQ